MPPATPNRNIALEQADVAVPNAPQNIVQVAPDAAPTEPDIAKIRASGCVRPADTMTYAQALVSDPTLNDGYTAFERNAIGLTEGPLPPGVTVTVTEVISTDDEAPATHDPVASPPSGTITDAAAIPIDGVGTTTESRVLASTETPISADDGWKNATPSSADAAAGWQTATSRCRKRVASRQASPEPGRQPVPTPTPQGRTGEAPSPANDEDTEWQIVHSRRGKRVAARRVTSDPGRQPVPDPITQAPTGEPVPFPASPENQRRNIVNYDKYARFGVMNSEPSSEPFFIEPNQPGPDMYTLPTGGPTIAIDLTATPDPFLKITKAPDSDKGTNMRILSVPQAVAPRTDEYDDMEKPVRPPYIKKVPANRDLAYTAALATFKAKADVTNAWIDDHSGDFDTPESYRDPRERRLAAARLIRHYPEAVDPDRVCLTAKEAFLDARLTVTEPPPSVHPDPAYADDEEGNDADDEGSDDNKGDDEKNDVEKGDDDESRHSKINSVIGHEDEGNEMTKRGDHATTKATPGSAAGGIFNGVWEAMVEGVKYIFGSKTKPTSKSVSISSTSEFEQILAKRSNHPTTEGALGAAAEGIIEGVLEAIVDGVKYIFRAKHRPTAVDSSKSVPDSLTTVPGQKNGGEPGGDWSDRTPWIFYGVYMTKDETTKGKA